MPEPVFPGHFCRRFFAWAVGEFGRTSVDDLEPLRLGAAWLSVAPVRKFRVSGSSANEQEGCPYAMSAAFLDWRPLVGGRRC